MSAEYLPATLDHWVSSGLMTADQAELIRADAADEASPATGQARADRDSPGAGRGSAGASRGSILAEALAHFGIVISLIATGLIVLATAPSARPTASLALSSILTVALWAAAPLVPLRFGPSASRVRAGLLFTSAGTFAASLALAMDIGAGCTGQALAIVVSAGTLLMSALLWRLHRSLAQQGAVLLSALATASIATSYLPHSTAPVAGLAIWATSATWFALAWGGIIGPRRGCMVLSAIGAVLGPQIIIASGGPALLAVATLGALLLVAIAFRDAVLLAIAAIGSLGVLPQAASAYFHHTLASGLTLLILGALLVSTAILGVNRGRTCPGPAPARRDWSSGTPGPRCSSAA